MGHLLYRIYKQAIYFNLQTRATEVVGLLFSFRRNATQVHNWTQIV